MRIILYVTIAVVIAIIILLVSWFYYYKKDSESYVNFDKKIPKQCGMPIKKSKYAQLFTVAPKSHINFSRPPPKSLSPSCKRTFYNINEMIDVSKIAPDDARRQLIDAGCGY